MQSFPINRIPSTMILSIQQKMPKREFQRSFSLDYQFKETYEGYKSRFASSPIHYLDQIKSKTITARVISLKDEYINRILKNIRNNSFQLKYAVIEFETTTQANLETVLSDLEAKVYWKDNDTKCLFAEAPEEHIFPSVRAAFTIKNKKGQLLMVKLTEFSLEVNPVEEENVLEEMWDVVRNSSKYPIPTIN